MILRALTALALLTTGLTTAAPSRSASRLAIYANSVHPIAPV
jgi:hypothetical protein